MCVFTTLTLLNKALGMKRRRNPRQFDKFPVPEIEQSAILEDTRSMDFMSKFRDYHVRTVFYFALLGMTEEQMAIAFDISMSVLQTWKKKHPTFLEALKKGKEQADAKMVYSLYQAGIGYEHDAEQIFCTKEKTYDPTTGKLISEVPKIIRVPIRKQYPPNVKAAIHWLQSRQPDQWSQKEKKTNKLVQNNFNFNINECSLEELQLLKKIQQRNGGLYDDQFMTTPQRQLQELRIEEEQ